MCKKLLTIKIVRAVSKQSLKKNYFIKGNMFKELDNNKYLSIFLG